MVSSCGVSSLGSSLEACSWFSAGSSAFASVLSAGLSSSFFLLFFFLFFFLLFYFFSFFYFFSSFPFFFYFKAQHTFLETRSHVAQDGMKLTAEPPASIHLPRAGSIPFAFHMLSCLQDRLYPQTMSPDRPSLFPATFSQVFCYSH